MTDTTTELPTGWIRVTSSDRACMRDMIKQHQHCMDQLQAALTADTVDTVEMAAVLDQTADYYAGMATDWRERAEMDGDDGDGLGPMWTPKI